MPMTEEPKMPRTILNSTEKDALKIIQIYGVGKSRIGKGGQHNSTSATCEAKIQVQVQVQCGRKVNIMKTCRNNESKRTGIQDIEIGISTDPETIEGITTIWEESHHCDKNRMENTKEVESETQQEQKQRKNSRKPTRQQTVS